VGKTGRQLKTVVSGNLPRLAHLAQYVSTDRAVLMSCNNTH